jgi:hypothetical protein
MRRIAFCSIGLLTLGLAGCGNEPTMETMKLTPPVNVGMQATTGEPSQLAAADALGRIGQPAVPALTEALMDGSPVVRFQAARALAFMGAQASSAVPALMQALNDQDSSVRQQSALALGQVGPPAAPAVPQLLQMLKMANNMPPPATGTIVPSPSAPFTAPGTDRPALPR